MKTMNKSSSKLLCSTSLLRAGLASALVLVPGAATLHAQTITDDFNTGTDTDWTHYALPYYGAPTYSFPADGSGGKCVPNPGASDRLRSVWLGECPGGESPDAGGVRQPILNRSGLAGLE